MNTKLIGGILLIVGTAIGGGMLALPVAAAELGFVNSTLLLLGCWLIMTFSAFLILEVNLWLPPNSNIISMAKATLGRWGEIVAWVVYLLLLYSLLAAYIAGGADFVDGLMLSLFSITLPHWLAAVIFAGVLSLIVYQGIRFVDYVNRGLMFGKLGIYLLLATTTLAFIVPKHLVGGELKYVTTSVTVMLTSFGFANIVPSLRSYFNSDVKKLRLAILIGSLIPLCCYIVWDMAIMGVISRTGEHGLITMFHSGHSTNDLTSQLNNVLNLSIMTDLARAFTFVCLSTSFLGVALSLTDFFADGLRLVKRGKSGLLIYAITFLPPLGIVLLRPNIFITALSYAGIYCMILLVLLPALMAWRGRYRKQLSGSFQLAGGKPVLFLLMATSIAIISQGALQSL